jgi:hypothetical protein
MHLIAAPFSEIVGIDSASDVAQLSFSWEEGLTVVVACRARAERVPALEVVFSAASAFRVLDECDLARYWSSPGFARGAYVLEVSAGGWLSEEKQLQGYERPRREWLVATGNTCVNVFCSMEPTVRNVELHGA